MRERVRERGNLSFAKQTDKNLSPLTFHLSLKFGFTLAEVLITLGIIGVVAAMTLPTVVNNIQKRHLQVGFKKAYSVLSQTVLNLKEQDGEGLEATYTAFDPSGGYVSTGYFRAQEFYDKFYNYSKLNIIGKCNYPAKIRNFTNTTDAYTSMTADGVEKIENATSDGMCVQVHINGYDINIIVDVNGTKKPNRLGYDIFYFYIDNKDSLQPRKMYELYTEETEGVYEVSGMPCSIHSNLRGNGIGCAYFALIDQSPDDETKGYWESLP